MGHMNVTENLAPLAERVGCGDMPWGKHEDYTPGCMECWFRNGGGND